MFSTVLLQMDVPNRLQGRVFAVELALLTLVTAVSNYVAGHAADTGWTPRMLALGIAAAFVPSGIALTLVLWRDKQPTAAQASAPVPVPKSDEERA